MIAALHSAARRYCIEQYAAWAQRHAELPPDPSGDYTAAQYDTFPRYNVLAAILDGLERHTPADFPTLRAARLSMASIAETAESLMTRTDHPLARSAMAQERAACATYILSVSDAELGTLPLLPWRRVLTRQESDRAHQLLKESWGVTEQQWFPLADTDRTDVLALDSVAYEEAGANAALRGLLESSGIARVLELREFGSCYECDISWFDPRYNGAEAYWTSTDMSWLVYASHERSTTFGGRILELLQEAWPEHKEYVW